LFFSTQAPTLTPPQQLTTGVPTVSNPTVTVVEGTPVTLHLYVQMNSGDAIAGLGLRHFAATPGVVSAASYSTPQITWPVDPDDPGAGNIIRWNTPINDGQLNTGGWLVKDTNAVGINAGSDPRVGLAFANNDDPTRKTLSSPPGGTGTGGGARAFYIATLTLNTLAPGATDLFLEVGDKTIAGAGLAGDLFFGLGDAAVVNDGATVGARSALPDARIVVEPIPEPASLSLLALGALPMLRRRRA
jgi:MYXO-CTERM domain-containing protein